LCGLIVTIVIVIIALVFTKGFFNSQQIASASSWEIVVAYNTETKKISLKDLKMVPFETILDSRDSEPNLYKLEMKNNNGQNMLSTNVAISTGFIFTIYIGDDTASQTTRFDHDLSYQSLQTPESLEIETVLYVPVISNAKEIVITQNEKKVLDIPLPQITNGMQVSEVAQATCGSLEVVFISDGYTDFGKFRQDTNRLKQAFLATYPYSKNPSMFTFHVLENTVPLGCVNSLDCIEDRRIPQIGKSQYPRASKFIVLADVTYNNPPNGTALGIINTIGGNVTAFPRSAILRGREAVDQIAIHELLGHGVGGLYDRYVVSGGVAGSVGANCSNTPAGQSFWANVGITQTYPGCATSQNKYAPAPLNCPNGGGSSASVMSAGGCGSSVFDTVETYYLENYVLPRYNACANVTNVPSPSRVQTPSLSPVPSKCDPNSTGDSAGIIDFADLRLARREIAGIALTNNAACMSGGVKTSFADLRKIRRIIAGLLPQ